MRGAVVLRPEVEKEGEYQLWLGGRHSCGHALSCCGSKSLIIALDLLSLVDKCKVTTCTNISVLSGFLVCVYNPEN